MLGMTPSNLDNSMPITKGYRQMETKKEEVEKSEIVRRQPSEIDKTSFLKGLVADVEELLGASRAENTKGAYESDIEHFKTWCESLGLCYLPAETETVYMYLTALSVGKAQDVHLTKSGSKWKTSSIMRRKSSISRFHTLANYPDPTVHERVLTTLKGLRRKHGVRQDGKAPFLSEHVVLAYPTFGHDEIGVRDRAIIGIGFSGALRRSEIANIDCEHMKFDADGISLLIPNRKTDQEGEGDVIGIPRDSVACPVHAMKAWLELSGITSGPVFRPVVRRKIKHTRLADREIARIIQRVVQRIGIEDWEAYGGHSLRAGFCTSAGRAGIEERIIMRQSGHSSIPTVRKYIRAGNLFVENAAKGLLSRKASIK